MGTGGSLENQLKLGQNIMNQLCSLLTEKKAKDLELLTEGASHAPSSVSQAASCH